MRAWQVCGTLGAHKSPQSMYYIGGRCERFAHSPPGARIQTRKANSRWESRKYDSPPRLGVNFYFPSTPFLELGVDALLVAQPLPSYCALIQAPQWERAINCWWRLLQLRCRHMKNRDDRFDLVKFLIPSRKSVGVRSLIPPLPSCSMLHNLQIWPTRGGARHPSLLFPAPKVCLLLL